MANAVAAGLRGHEYQALIFWLQACHLLRSGSGVQRVAYEFDGPKAFDDVVVWYDPPVPAGGPDRVRVRHIQSKFKVSYEDSFGHADLIDPAFINATSVSLLERLRDAQRGISEDGTGVRFQIRTIARLRTDDPLHKMVNAHDRSFLVHRLLDGKTDKSDLGREIRKPWRERLGLATDEELRPILYPLEIQDGSRSLMDLRSDLAVLVDSVGLEPVDMTVSGCRYCSTILSLNNRGLNDFDRERFEQTCREEKLFRNAPTPRPNDRMRVSIRSFTDPGVDPATGNDRLLLLTRHYSARYIAADDGWRTAIQPEVTGFLVGVAAEGKPIELAIDAHASIAFLSGHVLHPKLGVAVHLIQKTAGLAPQPWSINGEVPAGAPDLEFTEVKVGNGADIAIGIGIARDLLDDVRRHVADNLPAVGRIVVGTPAGGASATAVRNGAHASRLADAISNHVVKTRSRSGWQGDLHLYLAAPNGLVFMLGQRSRGFGPTVLYEFDFERRVKGYTPSITINKDTP